ncbi:MAG TPA: hypothetical protein VN963_01590 [bacterium]|nr:hypothetical protein [bacterium]
MEHKKTPALNAGVNDTGQLSGAWSCIVVYCWKLGCENSDGQTTVEKQTRSKMAFII